ncbi:MAG TPA: sensor histidine kinase [Solirubrobacteraceae bacterium]|nr:sensor histidine kinase [Solirubrobacteraceae bacterium]
MWRRGQLSNRILAIVLAILVATAVVGFALDTLSRRSELQHEYQRRALVIAQTFAAIPTVREALFRHDAADRRAIQALAQQVRHQTGASYIVVIDRQGIRFSHPDPSLIGKRVAEPVLALDGHDHLDVDHGNLGISARARVPLRAPDGQIIGEVSTGILENFISAQLAHELPTLLLYLAISLGIGIAASLALARRLKRDTFGLELHEIAALVQEREAMLHNIREGVITLDQDEHVTLINDEARRLLPIAEYAVGRTIEELFGPGRLRDLLSGATVGEDQVVLTDEHVLVVNHMTVMRRGRRLGAVITLRDRTEFEALIRELDGVDALTDALRAQQHEFSNRMHTLAGLIELGDHDAAVHYALDVSKASGGLAESIRAQIERPEIAAMLLAKTTIATERGVALTLTDDSQLPAAGLDTSSVLTIVGNLIDNAIDAAAAGPGPAAVIVRLASDDAIRIEVSDTGEGVPPEVASQIFIDGFTTKEAAPDRQRGIGLALVHRLVRRSGGTIEFQSASWQRGTIFSVVLPLAVEAQSEVGA